MTINGLENRLREGFTMTSVQHYVAVIDCSEVNFVARVAPICRAFVQLADRDRISVMFVQN
jgi:hypothetical protein